MQREEKLLNIAVVNYVDIKQSLRIIDLEESQSKEGLKIDNADNEDYAELLEGIPNEIADLWKKLSPLERKQRKVFVFNELLESNEDLYA